MLDPQVPSSGEVIIPNAYPQGVATRFLNAEIYDYQQDTGSVLPASGNKFTKLLKRIPGAKSVHKFGHAINDTVDAFCIDAYVQVANAESRTEQARVIGSVAAAGAAQLADRLRLPEAITIPAAIDVAEKHGKLDGSLALLLGVYGVQNLVGSSWGLGLRKFRHGTQTFDQHFPEYKNYAAEGNAGYLKTLYRQSILGIGVGNSPFMAGEVIHNPNITPQGILEKANRSSRRIALTAGAIGYGALSAAEEWYDKSIGVPGVIDWSVPEVVENMKKASFWVIGGLAIDIVPRILGKSIKSIRNAIRPSNTNKLTDGVM